jgi:DNA-binding transcriptional LysR family regulator
MIDLRKLRHLVAVARAQNFTRAAHSIGISQPALSRSIADLEEALGEPIFDRTGEGVIVTAFGRPILARAERLLADAEEFNRELLAGAQGQSGRLAFGAGPLVAALAFPALLTQLALDRPGLDVEARIGPGRELVEAVRRGRLEFAVFAEPVLASRLDLEVERIARLVLDHAVRQGHPLADADQVDAAGISAFPIASGSEAGLFDEWPVETDGWYQPSIRCEDFSILAETVRGSDAIWVTCARLARQSDLVVLKVDNAARREVPIVAVTARGRNLSPSARIAMAGIRSTLAREVKEQTG